METRFMVGWTVMCIDSISCYSRAPKFENIITIKELADEVRRE